MVECFEPLIDKILHLSKDCSIKEIAGIISEIVKPYPFFHYNEHSHRLVYAENTNVKIIDIISGSHHTMENAHDSVIVAVSFNKLGNRIATYSLKDGSVKLWRFSKKFLSKRKITCYDEIKVSINEDIDDSQSNVIDSLSLITKEESANFFLIRNWESGEEKEIEIDVSKNDVKSKDK